jgi:hypothetical protein
MPGAVRSNLDFSVVNAMRARRRVREGNAAGKLELLRRLHRQYVTGTLPRYTETRVEQSWNEQIFAKVLGYRTQFSHDELPFHILPKDYADGNYNDFSLGFFGHGRDRVLGSAELKSPGADLDAPQTGAQYKGRSPVEQALSTAQGHPDCRWVLVCNFTELRLYDLQDSTAPCATAFLPEVRTEQDLFALQALFGIDALIGSPTKRAEMDVAKDLDDSHPDSVLGAQDGCFRIVGHFTPDRNEAVPLYKLERALPRALLSSSAAPELISLAPEGPLAFPVTLRDGWLAIDAGNAEANTAVRVACSLYRDMQVTCRVPLKGPSLIDVDQLLLGVRFIVGTMGGLTDKELGLPPGRVSAELRDAAAVKLLQDTPSTAAGSHAKEGVQGDISAGETSLSGNVNVCSVVAHIVCEFAAHFRDQMGGVVLDPPTIKGRCEQHENQAKTTIAKMKDRLSH